MAKIGLKRFWELVALSGARRMLLVPTLLRASLEHAADAMPALDLVVLMGEAPSVPECAALLLRQPALNLLSIYVRR